MHLFLLIKYHLIVINVPVHSVTEPVLKQYQIWVNNCITGAMWHIDPVRDATINCGSRCSRFQSFGSIHSFSISKPRFISILLMGTLLFSSVHSDYGGRKSRIRNHVFFDVSADFRWPMGFCKSECTIPQHVIFAWAIPDQALLA